MWFDVAQDPSAQSLTVQAGRTRGSTTVRRAEEPKLRRSHVMRQRRRTGIWERSPPLRAMPRSGSQDQRSGWEPEVLFHASLEAVGRLVRPTPHSCRSPGSTKLMSRLVYVYKI
jgi:hypothetical protein